MTRRHNRGSVLIFTLWLTAGLAAAALMVGHTSMLHYRREANQESVRAAEQATEGALRYVLAALKSSSGTGQLPDAATYQAEDLTIGNCRVWILGRSDDAAADAPVFALGDEGGKLNLNTATAAMLESLPGMTPELAAAIIDWRDTDSDLTANGAETETYMALSPAYTAKNAPFESIDELRLLSGAAPLLLEGRDRNRNSLLEAWERTLAESVRERLAAVPDIGILEHVTVSSREPNTTANGTARVNLNGSAQTVRQALRELFGERSITMIAAAGLDSGPGLPPVRFGSVLEFCVKARIGEADAVQTFDRFTVATGNTIAGRVNINTAGVAVLACVPGITTDKAATLVAYRRQNSDKILTPLWLATAVGHDAATAAGPYVTTRSYQVSADIVGVGPNGRGFRRIRCAIDCTGSTPTVISRRDLSHLGWPLGETLYKSVTGKDRQGGNAS